MPQIEELAAADVDFHLELTRLDIVLAGRKDEDYNFEAAHGGSVSYAVLKYPASKKQKPTVWRIHGSRADREAAAAQVRTSMVEKMGAVLNG